MIYARMPELEVRERRSSRLPLDFSQARVDAAKASASLSSPPQRVRLGMFDARPVYRFFAGGRWTTTYADSGETLDGVTPEQALAAARRLPPPQSPAV